MKASDNLSIGSAALFFVLVTSWLAGIAIAEGFWMTLFSLMPFVSWYIVIEKILTLTNVI